jgi:DNA-binding NarL/FixJ family response regulator
MNTAQSKPDTVLIVDDTPANLAYLSDALNDAGFKVLVAIDGATALERLNLITPDIILLDAIMPGMNGFETCQAIKQRPDGRDIPVIFMTGLVDTPHVVRAFEQGAIDYVTKPVRQEEVLARIATHIARARMLKYAQQSIDSCGKAGFTVDAQGNITWQTPRAREWLKEYLNVAGYSQRWEQLRTWIDNIARISAGATDTTAQISLTCESGRLRVHYVGLTEGGERLLLLEEEHRHDSTAKRLALCWSLTSREAEVLNWLCSGKTNRDIAQILGISPRTVNKHLDRIYEKMGVETRSSATAIAIRTIASPMAAPY